MKPIFFATPSELRSWLEEHHDNADEVWVGFHKRASGKPSFTWPEAARADREASDSSLAGGRLAAAAVA
jgi:hypothetical protein